MRFITEIIRYFTFITTGIVILFIGLMLIEGDDSITLLTLIKIPLAALVTAAVTVLLRPAESLSKGAFVRFIALHYLVLCAVMIVIGTLFGWIRPDLPGILLMVISVAVIYAFTFAVAYLTARQDADELNRALRKRRGRK